MTAPEVIRRRAGRVVLLDGAGRILLLQGLDPTREDPPWWFTPGGGAEADETTREAAERELREETGLVFPDLIGPIWSRRAEFVFYGRHYEQYEEFFLAQVSEHDLVDDAWTELERNTVIGHRWFSLAELHDADEPVFPLDLARMLERLTLDGVPDQMIEIH